MTTVAPEQTERQPTEPNRKCKRIHDENLIESDRPSVTRHFANKIVGTVTRLAEAKDAAFRRNSYCHIEESVHRGRIVCEIDQYLLTVDFMNIAAARILVLLHGLQAVTNSID